MIHKPSVSNKKDNRKIDGKSLNKFIAHLIKTNTILDIYLEIGGWTGTVSEYGTILKRVPKNKLIIEYDSSKAFGTGLV